MRPPLTGAAERTSWRSAYLALDDPPRRGDLWAAAAAAVVLTELLLAQLTLVLVVCFLATGRLTRWRSLWLVCPAAAGLALMLSGGAGQALAGYLAVGADLARHLTGPGPVVPRLARLPGVLASWRSWLPAQMPVAVAVAAVQTRVVGLLGRGGLSGERSFPPGYRPGVLVIARRSYLTWSLRRGEVATVEGACLGIEARTGRRAAASWHEAEHGVLCTGQEPSAVLATGLTLVVAAIQHRKSVLVVDVAAGPHPGQIAAACAAAAAPLISFGAGSDRRDGPAGRYDPLADADPRRAAELAAAMIDWTGLDRRQRAACTSQLQAALILLRAGLSRGRGSAAVTGDLAALLRPGAMRVRLGELGTAVNATLVRQVGELSSRPDASMACLAAVAEQLARLGASPICRELGQVRLAGHHDPAVSLGQALAERRVLLFSLDRRAHGESAAMIARLVVADLAMTLARRTELGSPADCLVWINGCEEIDARELAALVRLGAGARAAVLLSTVNGQAAAALAAEVNVVAIRGQAPPGLDRSAVLGTTGAGSQPAGRWDAVALSLLVREPRRRIVAGRVVR